MSKAWSEVYPRPQMVRDEWLSLDGPWSFSIKKEGEPGMPPMARAINVPFCPESSRSGIGERIKADDVMLYGRSFTLPEGWSGRRVLLHFGAVDQAAKVYVDGKYAGSHEGGYLPFSFDITDLLKTHEKNESAGDSKSVEKTEPGELTEGKASGRGSEAADDVAAKEGEQGADESWNSAQVTEGRAIAGVKAGGSARHSIIVEVRDSLDHKYPWGKQKVKNGGMWYTPVSGIWQSVWLEPVPEEHITSLKIDTGSDWAEVTAYGISSGTLELAGRTYEMCAPAPETVNGGVCATVRIKIDEPRRWSPEDPYLYEFSITAGGVGENLGAAGSAEIRCHGAAGATAALNAGAGDTISNTAGAGDSIKSYFALRTLTIEEKGGHPRLCLNGEPYFFNGVLDQGYWHDGIYTPPSPDCFAIDIKAMKSLGFNTLRKHIKIEPQLFYYECDRLGMVVFQDMVNNSEYSFLRDTALPTVGIKRLNDKKAHADLESRRIFRESMAGTVRLLYNHPSVCCWTIFNEGWGQFDADSAYDRLKAMDGSRFVDSTSGWFWQSKSDVDSYHVYFKKAALEPGRRPMVLSEFGGYACRVPGHYFGGSREYGYRKCADAAALQRDIEKLYREEIEPLKEKGLCAAIYTQLSDVEDETNGLLTYDREVMKMDPETFCK